MSGHIRRRSLNSWELRYPAPRGPDGKRKTATTTFHGTKKAAAAKLRELMGAVDKGQHVDRSSVTIATFVDERVALWAVSTLTRERYEERARLIKRHLGAIPLQRLSTRDVERWHGQLRTGGLAPTTIRYAHQLLARVLDDAQRHSMVVRNVARLQPPPAVPAGRIEVPTEDRLAPMLEALRGTELYAPAVLTIYCGLRRGELLALRWSDIDLDNGALTITQAVEESRTSGIRIKTPKTTSGTRTISMPTTAVEALRDHRRQQLELRMALGAGRLPDDALVFPTIDGGLQSPNAFSARWRRTVRRLKLPVVTWHGLRHVHCSLLLRHGVDITTASRRLGHSRVDVTARVYAHAIAKDDRHAAAALETALG